MVNEKWIDAPGIDVFGVGIVHVSIIRDTEARPEEEADFWFARQTSSAPWRRRTSRAASGHRQRAYPEASV